jgi:hypothetical protein
MTNQFAFQFRILVHTTHTNTRYMLKLNQSWISYWHWLYLMHVFTTTHGVTDVTMDRLMSPILISYKILFTVFLALLCEAWCLVAFVFKYDTTSCEFSIHLASPTLCDFLICIVFLHHPLPPSHGKMQNNSKSFGNLKVRLHKKS